MVLQGDRILVAGVTGNPYKKIALARYTSSGVLDKTFGSVGKVVFDPGFKIAAKSVVLHDGGIVVGATATSSVAMVLMEAFATSPEGSAVAERYGDAGWAHSFLYYGFNYLGSAPPDMSRRDVGEILFDLFPRKVSTTPDTAGEIIAEMRAFWEFLRRAYGLTNATSILQDLGDDAERRLARELDDPQNFGMAKSFVMMGNEAGFDMTTQEGLNEFMHAFNAGLVARQSGGPPPAQREPLPQYHPEEPPSKPKPIVTRLSAAERKSREKLRLAKLGKSKRRR